MSIFYQVVFNNSIFGTIVCETHHSTFEDAVAEAICLKMYNADNTTYKIQKKTILIEDCSTWQRIPSPSELSNEQRKTHLRRVK